ncbi:MAG: Na/Pi cotransporter family protein [Clostridiales bacterium]|nr:Na/Pi cotransporter family protein [Clostridiales bacterium]MDD7387396.1 Na/Pi cotransporter family protein [Bacillota bacterium]MDY6040349.1 Na/Pi cotransporter family protein [Candidatus Faecousia sp.]
MEIFHAIIKLLGGLAMFLYGIEVMGDGLKNSSGAALKRILEKVTGNVLVGVLTGTLVTAVIQSSTATIVLTVALIGAGVLNLKQAVSIVLGANIGTTVTAQIIRLSSIEAGDNWILMLFNTDTLAPVALVVGIILLMFIKTKSAKTIGDIFIGFGILFVGLDLMTSAVEPLSQTEAFRNVLMQLNNPVLGIAAGLILTVIVQSSSAMVGMLQALSVSGAMTFSMVYPVIMGINLGTCVTTAMVCSIGTSKDAKRTGVVHIAFNTIGTILFMLVMTLLQSKMVFGASFWSSPVDSGGIANFQTVFNLLTAIALLPFTNQLVKLSMAIVRDDKPEQQRHPEMHTLDDKLYISPAVAVAEATKAVAAMGAVARDNFVRGLSQLVDKLDPAQFPEIDADEDCLDQFADEADRFLIGLSKAVETEMDDRQLDMLMQTVPNFERIGDYATNLVELAQRLQEENGVFSDTAKKELQIIGSAVKEILNITVDAFTSGNNEAAKSIEPLEEVIDDMVMILKDRHTKRLKNGSCSVSSGLVFMESLTYLERASDQCSSIAVMMMARNNEAILQNHYDYLREIHEGNDEHYRMEKNRRRDQFIAPLKELK